MCIPEGTMGCLLHQSPNVYKKYSLIRWLNNLGILMGWFINLRVQTFQPPIVIYRRDNFVFYHWGCKSIYRPMSYPFRSMCSLPPLAQYIKLWVLVLWVPDLTWSFSLSLTSCSAFHFLMLSGSSRTWIQKKVTSFDTD